jgi:hypothetical protein
LEWPRTRKHKLLSGILRALVKYNLLNMKSERIEKYLKRKRNWSMPYTPGYGHLPPGNETDINAPSPTQDSIDQEFLRATKIEICHGGQRCTSLSDSSEIRDFSKMIQIHENGTYSSRLLIPNIYIDLFENDWFIGRISLVDGYIVRWNEKWKNDAILKNPMEIIDWLAVNGSTVYQTSYKKIVKYIKERDIAERNAKDTLPEYLMPFWEYIRAYKPDLDNIWRVLNEKYNDKAELALFLFELYINSHDYWVSISCLDNLIEHLLSNIPVATIINLFESKNISNIHIDGIGKYLCSSEFYENRAERDLIGIPMKVRRKLLKYAVISRDHARICETKSLLDM